MTTVEFTSDVVRNTKFRDKMRGYHPEEVDAFLERTATALDLLQSRLTEVTERAMKAEAALETNSEADESIRKTLTLAQRTAEMAVREANEDADRIRTDARTEAERLNTETDDACRQRVAEADERLSAAKAEAATMVETADREAAERRQATEEALSIAERESRERMQRARAEAEAAQAAQAEAARRDLDAMVSNLTGQRDELRSAVEALATYLAIERARVIDTLTAAVDSFGQSLRPAKRSHRVRSAMRAEFVEAAFTPPAGWPSAVVALPPVTADEPALAESGAVEPSDPPADRPSQIDATAEVAAGAEAVPADEGVEPAGEGVQSAEATPAATDNLTDTATAEPVGEAAVDEPTADPGPPSSLLFTLEDELHRSESDHAESSEARGRKPKAILGRRRG